MNRSEKLHADAERHRTDYNRLRSIGGRAGLYPEERARIERDAVERRPKPIGFDEARELSSASSHRTIIIPGDHVSLRADSMLGLLVDLADAEFRAVHLEAMQLERWEAGNARLERTISDLRHENSLLVAKVGRLSDRKRKAKSTEAQRRKAGDRRRRNAR